MTMERSRNRRVRTIAIALLIASFDARPRNLAQLDYLMESRGTPPEQRIALRKAFVTGGITFFCQDTARFASLSRLFSPEYMRREYNAAVVMAQGDLRKMAKRLIDGKATVDEFRRYAEREIETLNLDAGFLLMGPLLAAVPAAIDRVRDAILRQLTWFRRLLDDIASGRQRLDGSLLRRIGMYGGSGHSTVEEIGRILSGLSGFREERNVLGIAEHCEGCLRETARGWVSIGALVPIGERDCLSNCRCSYEYR